jgi:hypothetical protein
MTLTRPVLLSMVAACATLAGCGSDDSSGSGSGSAPATTAAAAAVPATTPAATTTAETTANTASTSGERKDADGDGIDDVETVKGRLGDALTLVGQPGYKKPSAVKVKVTVTKLTGPFSGFNLQPGRKLIGVEVHFSNLGKKTFDDPLPGGKLTLTGGESGKQTSLISTGKASPCDNPSLKLGPGQAKDVCIAYDVPKEGKPEAFEYGVDNGYGDTGLWRLS